MSDLYHKSLAYSQGQYRAATDRHATTAGITLIPQRDKCCACGVMRTAITGVYTKSGKFVCGMRKPKSARIAGKTKPASQSANSQPASKSQEQF